MCNCLTNQKTAAHRPYFPVTDAQLVTWEASPFTDLHDAVCEIRRLQARVNELLVANTQEVHRRREFEEEASQARCEQQLFRVECIRLRNLHRCLAGFIEQVSGNAGADESIPDLLPGTRKMEKRNPRLDPMPGDVLRGEFSTRHVCKVSGRLVKYKTTERRRGCCADVPGALLFNFIASWRLWAATAEVVHVAREDGAR
jgi:hypothetical protein